MKRTIRDLLGAADCAKPSGAACFDLRGVGGSVSKARHCAKAKRVAFAAPRCASMDSRVIGEKADDEC